LHFSRPSICICVCRQLLRHLPPFKYTKYPFSPQASSNRSTHPVQSYTILHMLTPFLFAPLPTPPLPPRSPFLLLFCHPLRVLLLRTPLHPPFHVCLAFYAFSPPRKPHFKYIGPSCLGCPISRMSALFPPPLLTRLKISLGPFFPTETPCPAHHPGEHPQVLTSSRPLASPRLHFFFVDPIELQTLDPAPFTSTRRRPTCARIVCPLPHSFSFDAFLFIPIFHAIYCSCPWHITSLFLLRGVHFPTLLLCAHIEPLSHSLLPLVVGFWDSQLPPPPVPSSTLIAEVSPYWAFNFAFPLIMAGLGQDHSMWHVPPQVFFAFCRQHIPPQNGPPLLYFPFPPDQL